VISTHNLNTAFAAVYAARDKDGPNSDIWTLSLQWNTIRQYLQTTLLAGHYTLSPAKVYHIEHDYLTRWSAQDAVVLKAISLILAPLVANFVGMKCHHLKDHGGVKGAVTQVQAVLKGYSFVVKSDVRQYYESMDHEQVLIHCKMFIKDKRILSLIAQYLNHCEILNGEHRLVDRGISKGCPLSPLMGAIILKSLDASIPKEAFYARYMDDWVILLRTRGQTRRVVKKMHHIMAQLGFDLAPDKTFIGRISKGFDFLGYHFNIQGIIGIATSAIQKFTNNIDMLYEQGASASRIYLYATRWLRSFSGLHITG
jgi:RNA-directed DNA polymerase